MPRISSKHQVTLPVEMLERSGLRAGDEVSFEADGPDRIVVLRTAPQPDRALGVFDGLYEPGHLDRRRGARARVSGCVLGTDVVARGRCSRQPVFESRQTAESPTSTLTAKALSRLSSMSEPTGRRGASALSTTAT